MKNSGHFMYCNVELWLKELLSSDSGSCPEPSSPSRSTSRPTETSPTDQSSSRQPERTKSLYLDVGESFQTSHGVLKSRGFNTDARVLTSSICSEYEETRQLRRSRNHGILNTLSREEPEPTHGSVLLSFSLELNTFRRSCLYAAAVVYVDICAGGVNTG